MKDILPHIDRRTTLKWLTAATAWSAVHHRTLAHQPSSKINRYVRVANGYGTDPDLVDPKVSWKRTLTATERRQFALLVDTILPATENAPAASAVGVVDFLDEWVSAPYELQMADRSILMEGMEHLDRKAKQVFSKTWLTITDIQRSDLLDKARLAGALKNTRHGDSFFGRARALTVGIYFCTEAGWRDLGYIGNVALAEFPPVSKEVREVIDSRLKQLRVPA